LLCEDDVHRRLAVAYMNRCNINRRIVVEKIASRLQRGGNNDWVLRAFPAELHACRQRHKRAKTLLVVVVDADKLTVGERRRQLTDSLKVTGYEELAADDPVAFLITRRNVETWIRALLVEKVNEDDDYKKPRKEPTKDEIREAADNVYQWARPNADAGPTCVPSLKIALTEWWKIG
jgi:hypothetical protein